MSLLAPLLAASVLYAMPMHPAVRLHAKRPTKIAVVNRAADVAGFWDATTEATDVAALQVQVDQFKVYWHAKGATLRIYRKKAPAGAWQVILTDKPIYHGTAVGTHWLNGNGVPYALIDVATCARENLAVSAVMSHELLEMLADPSGQATAENSPWGAILLEVADPVVAYTYQINGVSVADFVTPLWFGIRQGPQQFDYLNMLLQKWELGPGGFVIQD